MIKRLTIEEFIIKSNKVHNNKYDYSLVKYKNNHTPVKIICPIHGIFEQIPNNHFKQGCLYCSGKKKLTNDEFIIKSNKVHNNKYDYKLSEYKGRLIKIKIICPEHGEFEQTPKNHMKGHGCSFCGGSNKKTTENVINEMKKTHNNKYDYSIVEYRGAKTKVEIICKIHGIFEQTPESHILGNGCQLCNESKGEKKITQYLKENNIDFIRQHKFDKCKNKRVLPFDFYLPELNICIEYDGIQHFKSIKYFGGDSHLSYVQNNDKIKNEYCKNNNIKLLRIDYTENNIQEKIMNYYAIL